MRLFSSFIFSGLAGVIILSQGCTKQGPQGPAGPALTGTLYGYVELEDQYGARVLSGQNATVVTLSSASSNGASSTVTTDSTGKYSFPNLTTGQYIISFSNVGYGSILNSPQGFLGGGNIDRDAKLSAIPNFTDSITSISDTAGFVTITGTLSGTDIRKRTVAIFVNSNSTVGPLAANYLTFYSVTANNNLTTFTAKIAVSDLNDVGLTSGATAYFAVYAAAANFSGTSDYEDYTNTGKLSFSALSPTAATANIVLQ